SARSQQGSEAVARFFEALERHDRLGRAVRRQASFTASLPALKDPALRHFLSGAVTGQESFPESKAGERRVEGCTHLVEGYPRVPASINWESNRIVEKLSFVAWKPFHCSVSLQARRGQWLIFPRFGDGSEFAAQRESFSR